MKSETNSGTSGRTFQVPCIVADNLLKLTTEKQLKVLLYILRNTGNNANIKEISVNTGVPEQEIDDCLAFWKQLNVLPCGTSELSEENTAGSVLSSLFQPVPEENTVSDFVSDTTQTNDSNAKMDAIVMANPEMSELFHALQGRIINFNAAFRECIIDIYENLHLSCEVIYTLITCCEAVGKANISYIKKVAWDWAEKGITTPQAASIEAQYISEMRTYTYEIMRMFEMKRHPTTSQQAFIDQWKDAGYSMELIKYAYELNIENIEKLSFPYINKVLLAWSVRGITTLEDAKNAPSDKKPAGKSKGKKRSYGFNAEDYECLVNNFEE